MICKILYGSHLYGLNTENSDTDYKGVFLPVLRDLLLQKAPEHISKNTNKSDSKNTNMDVDFELFSIHKFMKLVASGQPMAIEMLFAPKSYVTESTQLWWDIVNVREQLLTNKIKAFVGYCRNQATKYCTKGDRLKSLDDLINTFEYALFPQAKLEVGYKELCERMEGRVGFEKIINAKNIPAFKILGKEYCCNTKISTILESLYKQRGKYGKRSEGSKEMGGADWKALSHALRISFEAQEILSTGKLTLPLRPDERQIVMDVKLGRVGMEEVEKGLTQVLDNVDRIQCMSKLPDEFDQELADKLILKNYGAW